jgi:mRNA interferase YafQ
MYQLIPTTKFKKDLKKVKRNLNDYKITSQLLHILEVSGIDGIPVKMKPHKLKGEYIGDWECHIKPDLLIIWFQIESPKIIKLIRVGSHSDLFK